MAGLPLSFSVVEGDIINRFWKDETVAAHALARSGGRPRLVVAFAAGNEGAGLWFGAGGHDVALELDELERADANGCRGITTVLRASVRCLWLDRAVLGSVRLIRIAEHHRLADGGPNAIVEGADGLELWRRVGQGRRLRLRLKPLPGTSLRQDSGRWMLRARDRVQVQITALGEATPLTPLGPRRLLRQGGGASSRHLQALAFLAFEEKLLAGSWRFLTYFGRDTLLAARLLAPVIHHRVMEGAIGSALERIGPGGEVAHEEEIGDWAWGRRRADRTAQGTNGVPRRLEGGAGEAPIHDYKMVDDDFLLAPVVAHYLLDDPEGRRRAGAFLERAGPDGETYLAALRRNVELVLRLARPFAAEPSPQNLIALRQGQVVGNWRDSKDGLGGGRFPFDVNAILVPAALTAAGRLLHALLGEDELAAQARGAARVWDRAWDLFDVRSTASAVLPTMLDYAASRNMDPRAAVDSMGSEVCFSALALDGAAEKIPVMNSDGALSLLFCEPCERRLRQVARLVLCPFPAGLRTAAGILVANPALAADAAVCGRFTRNHYHGAVVWSWQQALFAAGLARQLRRRDLSGGTRTALSDAEVLLWEVIKSTRSLEGSELWSWTVDRGHIVAVPFGQREQHLTESNAVQLWSTVYLGISSPTPRQ